MSNSDIWRRNYELSEFGKGFLLGRLFGGSGDGDSSDGCLAFFFMGAILIGIALIISWHRSILITIGIFLYPSMWDYFHDIGIGYKGLVVAGSLLIFTFASAALLMMAEKVKFLFNIFAAVITVNFIILVGRLIYYVFSFIF